MYVVNQTSSSVGLRRGGDLRPHRAILHVHKRALTSICNRSLTCQVSVVEPAASSAPVVDGSSADRWYSSNCEIPRCVDGVKIAILEGKGRGVVAARDFALGEVVLATPPLAIVTSPQRQRPSGELVVDQILERRLYGSKWFSVLYDGSARSCKAQFALAPDSAAAATGGGDSTGDVGQGRAAVEAAAEAPRLDRPPEPMLASTSGSAAAAATAAPQTAAKKKGFLASRAAARKGKAGAAAAAGTVGGAGPAGEAAADSLAALPLPDRREQTRLAKVVKFNCFGDDAEDLAACECRGEPPRGHIGLWPEFAMLNHSCSPNAVNYVVGGSMVVRACRPIKAGEEVSISYLGRPQLLPVNRRISALSEDYGFECNCVRCTAELDNYDKVEDVYMELWEAVDERLGPAFLEARAAGDLEAIRGVQQQLQAELRRLYGLFRKTLLSPDVRNYVVASLYDAYDLSFSCAAALGAGEDASSLQACLKAIEAVSGGSDLHVILAVRQYDWTRQQHGEDSPLTGLARAALRRAHVARYGAVSEELLGRLVELNRRLHCTAEA